ncbi:MAG TPA: DUF6221 family protein [Jiangellaceae bacterium]|nr:DUF6221 family protein [Jiangellaceae bacterium]
MTDLASWVLAQIADDEAAARAATPGPWRYNPAKHWRKPDSTWFEEAVFAGPVGDDAICIAGTGETDDTGSAADAVHIARHDPARVLAECAAKRAIVELHKPRLNGFVMGRPGESREQMHNRWNSRTEMVCPTCMDGVKRATAPCLTLRLLAQPYADRPGWGPAWRVDA